MRPLRRRQHPAQLVRDRAGQERLAQQPTRPAQRHLLSRAARPSVSVPGRQPGPGPGPADLVAPPRPAPAAPRHARPPHPRPAPVSRTWSAVTVSSRSTGPASGGRCERDVGDAVQQRRPDPRSGPPTPSRPATRRRCCTGPTPPRPPRRHCRGSPARRSSPASPRRRSSGPAAPRHPGSSRPAHSPGASRNR